jgi:hypothetical protein
MQLGQMGIAHAQQILIVKTKILNSQFSLFCSLWKPENKDPHWPKERTLFLPFWAAPWLRQQIAEMLAKDGEENVEKRIGPMPTVPEWVEQLQTNRTTTTTQTETKT